MGLEVPHPHLLDAVHVQVHLQPVVQPSFGHRVKATRQRRSGLHHQDPESEALRGAQGGQLLSSSPGPGQACGQGRMAQGAPRDGLLPEGGSAPIKGDNPRERVANNMDVGIQQLDHGSETLPPPAAPANVTPRYPRLTASALHCWQGLAQEALPGASKDRHFFWGEAECGLILPSILLGGGHKGEGSDQGGLNAQILPGLWKASRGGSRFLQITGEHRGSLASLQLVLDEPPEALYNKWIKERICVPCAAPGMSALSWWAR